MGTTPKAQVNASITSTTVSASKTKNKFTDDVAAQEESESALDANEDRSAYLRIVLITLIASGLCFIVIITAVVFVACCRAARKNKLQKLKQQVVQEAHPPTTNSQRKNSNNTAVASTPPGHMQQEISVGKTPLTCTTRASYCNE